MASSEHDRLPSEVIHRSRPASVAATITGTLLTVVLINIGFNQHLASTPHNFGYWLVDYKWNLLERTNQPVDWLILGDSSGNQGVDPDVLEDTLGGEAINLCTIGHGLALNDALMLDEYLRRFPPPRAVIIVHVYDVWHRKMTQPFWARIPSSVTRRASYQPACAEGWRNQIRLFLHRYVPLDTQTKTLQKVLQGRKTDATAEIGYFDEGFLVTSRAYVDSVHDDTAGHLARLETRPEFRMSDGNVAALKTIVALADDHDLPVFIMPAPIYEGLWSNPQIQKYWIDGMEQLQAIAASSPHVHCPLIRPLTFPAEQMQNADHLTAIAARRYTLELARQVSSSRAYAADPPLGPSVPRP